MGYYSDFRLDYDEDTSYPSPEQQLLWRLKDLEDRLDELKENGEERRYKDDGLRLTDDDIRYAIPEYFKRVEYVERAIDLTIYDLNSKYNIDITAMKINDSQHKCNIAPAEQICFDDVVIIPPLKSPLNVA